MFIKPLFTFRVMNWQLPINSGNSLTLESWQITSTRTCIPGCSITSLFHWSWKHNTKIASQEKETGTQVYYTTYKWRSINDHLNLHTSVWNLNVSNCVCLNGFQSCLVLTEVSLCFVWVYSLLHCTKNAHRCTPGTYLLGKWLSWTAEQLTETSKKTLPKNFSISFAERE